ncbi:MAG: S8 family serine peptidase [Acidimicrobiales bacterium]
MGTGFLVRRGPAALLGVVAVLVGTGPASAGPRAAAGLARSAGPLASASLARSAGPRAAAGLARSAGPLASARPVAKVRADDPYFSRQWGLARIGAARAWGVSDGTGITIGVVDTGVDLGHEDLVGKVAGSTNCVGSAGNPAACHGAGQDDNGHGTHVSGIAAAVTGNGRGVASVAPGSRLLVAKALINDAQHPGGASGSSDDIVAGIRWVVDHGARVVNLSLGGDSALVTSVLGSPLSDGIEYAWQHGAVPVIASGNENLIGVGGSSNYANLDAVVVGATDRRDRVASYSSPIGNAKWGIVAPGGAGGDARDQATYITENVVSTWFDTARPASHDLYAALAGTSMATPHVAGAVALLLAQGLTPPQAVQRLLATAAPISCGSGCHGRLDVARAVGAPAAAAPGPAPTTASPASGSTPGPASRLGSDPTTGAASGGSRAADPNAAPTPGAGATRPAAAGSGPQASAAAGPGVVSSAAGDPGRIPAAVELSGGGGSEPGTGSGERSAAGPKRSVAAGRRRSDHRRLVDNFGSAGAAVLLLVIAVGLGVRRRRWIP